MYDKMLADRYGAQCWAHINNHIATVPLNKSKREITGKKGYCVDEFGVVWNKNGADKEIGVIEGTMIASPEMLNKYEFPTVDEKYIRSAYERLANSKQDNFTAVTLGFSLFERAWTLCSMEDLLCYMITDPEFLHELMQKITDYNLKK